MVANDTQTMSVPASRLLGALSQAFTFPIGGIDATLAALRGLDGDDYAGYGQLVDEVLETSGQFESQTAQQLAYTRLFIGSMHMEAPPYASYYLEREHTLYGQAAVEVKAVYQQFGIDLDADQIAPPDHLRYLLAFESLLARRYEETGDASFAEAYADFRDDYILCWIDDCKALVDRCAEEPYYPALMALIVAVLKETESANSALTGD